MNLPLDLAPASNILVAGAGGGYDIICALPMALSLREQGHRVHLASYTFSAMDKQSVVPGYQHLYEVGANSPIPESLYFPEGYLAQWWLERFGEEISIWAYHKVGVRPLALILAHLQSKFELDAIVILDAGVDGYFEGSEYNLGTPSIDCVSIIAGSVLPGIKSYFGSTAFGTEGRAHSVRHSDALMRMAQQVAMGAMLGVSAVVPQSSEGKQFMDAVEYIHQRSGPDWNSNMASSLVAALNGKFGHQKLNIKTQEAPIWVSPLTLLYWFFDLESVAKIKPFYKASLETDTVPQMNELIESTRSKGYVLPKMDIPI